MSNKKDILNLAKDTIINVDCLSIRIIYLNRYENGVKVTASHLLRGLHLLRLRPTV